VARRGASTSRRGVAVVETLDEVAPATV